MASCVQRIHKTSVDALLQMSVVPGMRAIASRCAPLASMAAHGVRVSTVSCPTTLRAHHPTLSIPSAAHHVTLNPARHLACAASGDAASAAAAPFKLIIYSKADCPLCDKLKEKLEAIQDRAAFAPSVLSGVPVEVRDITTNPAWEAAYAMEVPVMRVADPDGGNEKTVPRASPRGDANMLEKHLEKYLGGLK